MTEDQRERFEVIRLQEMNLGIRYTVATVLGRLARMEREAAGGKS